MDICIFTVVKAGVLETVCPVFFEVVDWQNLSITKLKMRALCSVGSRVCATVPSIKHAQNTALLQNELRTVTVLYILK